MSPLCAGSGDEATPDGDPNNMEGFCRRGRLTCHHGEEDMSPHERQAQALLWYDEADRSIQRFYVEAARRLPLEQIPELVRCIHMGGHCIGLADPVSNIILNAIRGLCSPSAGGEDPRPPKRPRPTHFKEQGERDWSFIASSSRVGLLVFMVAYFRYLTEAQARLYLTAASYDLSLAIKLVHRERISSNVLRALLPDGGKTMATLRIAAFGAGHPAPNDLAALMTAQYPSDLLSTVVAKVQGEKMISTEDVWHIRDLLARRWLPTPTFNLQFLCPPNGDTYTRGSTHGTLLHLSGCIGENLFARITIENGDHFNPLQRGYISDLTFDSAYMDEKLSNCVALVSRGMPGAVVNYDAYRCDHILSVKMCLLDSIHALYIKALAILPSNVCGFRFLRALLVAGHCYGLMDPVSNIILSAIWYDITFPPREMPIKDDIEAQGGILDTGSMSRLEARSLDGLVAILQATGSTPLSEHEALEHLYCCNCDLSQLYRTTRTECNSIPFAVACKAAKHPRDAAFGSFLMSLASEKLSVLQHLLAAPAGGRITHAHWNQLTKIISKESAGNTVLSGKRVEAPCLSPQASLLMSRKKSSFRHMLIFIRGELNRVLDEYCNQHPWEPRYKLDIICGLCKDPRSFQPKVYHANFLASTEGNDDGNSRERTLFFAEFWEFSAVHFMGSKPSCCPVYSYHAYTGRCSGCEEEATNIVHPPPGSHSGSHMAGSTELYRSLYYSTTSMVDRVGFEWLLDSDYIYFDPVRDVELGKVINNFCDHQVKCRGNPGLRWRLSPEAKIN